MKLAIAMLKWLARTVVILLLVIVGSTVLVRFAPGYFSDEREMDTRYADAARVDISKEVARNHSIVQMLSNEIGELLHGNGGLSRQYGVPTSELILPCLAVTGTLLGRALLLAWILAISASLVSSAGRNPWLLWQAPATFLLAVPTAAMATICLLTDHGGPVLVLALLLGARDFKFLHRMLSKAWLDAHVLHARAQGIPTGRLLLAHVLPAIAPQLAALAPLSIVTALSALVPVEVIFNVHGLGQLAWNAAMNRDLPVLLALTLVMALAVTLSGMAPHRSGTTTQWNSV
jgi:ABC-type dipeptide/oligopeptide/nickel transport system permease component